MPGRLQRASVHRRRKRERALVAIAVYHASADVEAHLALLRQDSRFALTCHPQRRPAANHRSQNSIDAVLWELVPGRRPPRRLLTSMARGVPLVSYSHDPGREVADLSRSIGFVSHLTVPLSPLEVEQRLILGTPGDLASRIGRFERTLGRHLRQVETLAGFVTAFEGATESADVAAALAARAATWLPAPAWAVVAAAGIEAERIVAAHHLPPSLEADAEAVAGWVIRRGEPFSSSRLDRDGRVRGGAAIAVLGFPLTAGRKTVGALVGLDHSQSKATPRLSARARSVLALYLGLAGHALVGAERLSRLEALSVTDDLTQLYNSRYLTQALRRETKRTVRSSRPLSLVFVDLDGFKMVNDAHGHLAGSRALVEAGAVIRGCARETDVVSRFGGDEFAVILPETDAEGAISVGERIRDRIADHRFLAEMGLEVRLTASVGIATLPADAQTAEGLVEAADRAMYWVKEHGKNGIRVAKAS
jgi:diguanylate cyclase (GGDEF)-like protein